MARSWKSTVSSLYRIVAFAARAITPGFTRATRYVSQHINATHREHVRHVRQHDRGPLRGPPGCCHPPCRCPSCHPRSCHPSWCLRRGHQGAHHPQNHQLRPGERLLLSCSCSASLNSGRPKRFPRHKEVLFCRAAGFFRCSRRPWTSAIRVGFRGSIFLFLPRVFFFRHAIQHPSVFFICFVWEVGGNVRMGG